MKKRPSTQKARKKIDWVAVAAEVRAKCNELTDVEREKLLEDGMKMIYGSDAKPHARSH